MYRRASMILLLPAFLVTSAVASCGGEAVEESEPEVQASAAAEATPASTYPPPDPEVHSDAHVVEVVAEDYAFEAPDEIMSGWTTLRFRNGGEETHFLYLTRVPEGRTYDDYVTGISAAINEVWYQMRDEGLEKAAGLEQVGAAIPAWYWEGAEAFGGPGLVVPAGVSQVTVDLPPGTYVLECFMKTEEGEFHWSEGMIHPLTVTEERSSASPPEASVQITLTTDAIEVEGDPVAGTNTMALTFADQPDVGFGNDVHIVHLGDDTDPASLVSWMDAFNVEGLQNPAPAAFVGGSHERTEGNMVYFSVELLPGRYAFISESAEETGGIFREFTVR